MALNRPAESTANLMQMISGDLTGGRALKGLKEREKLQKEMDEKKAGIAKETNRNKFARLASMGQSEADRLEDKFKSETVGLISKADYAAKRQGLDDAIAGKKKADAEAAASAAAEKKKAVKRAVLSFDADTSDESADDEPVIKKVKKNPAVDTSFLPDSKREQELAAQKADLIKEYNRERDAFATVPCSVRYAYWDGSGKIMTAEMTRGSTVLELLEKAKRDLEPEFGELRRLAPSHLMFVKEDLIVPYHVKLHDLIKSKARGRSGEILFTEVPGPNDLAAKVVEKRWYDENRHIFPASRWEMYDASKGYDGTYVVRDKDSIC